MNSRTHDLTCVRKSRGGILGILNSELRDIPQGKAAGSLRTSRQMMQVGMPVWTRLGIARTESCNARATGYDVPASPQACFIVTAIAGPAGERFPKLTGRGLHHTLLEATAIAGLCDGQFEISSVKGELDRTPETYGGMVCPRQSSLCGGVAGMELSDRDELTRSSHVY